MDLSESVPRGGHPSWCTRKHCTAYPMQPVDREYHRSEPLIVSTEDPGVAVYVHRSADPDGSAQYVEIVELDIPFDGPSFEARARFGQELILPLPIAEALRQAIGARLSAGSR